MIKVSQTILLFHSWRICTQDILLLPIYFLDLIYCDNLNKLGEYIKQVNDFNPKKLKHNNKIIKTIEDFIDNI